MFVFCASTFSPATFARPSASRSRVSGDLGLGDHVIVYRVLSRSSDQTHLAHGSTKHLSPLAGPVDEYLRARQH